MSVVAVDHLWKAFRRPLADAPRSARRRGELARRSRTWALRDVSFEVAEGSAVALVGSNGSGKSTLLRLMSGVTTPTRGTVRVDGRVNALLTLGDGFQPLLTGEENAFTGALLSGMTRVEARAALPSIAAFADLEGVMDQPVREYSDGMRMRLAFATAMALTPEVLLVDEVLAVGDLRFRERCLGRLDELRDRGVTMVFVSHDLAQVERLCDRALWLLDGEVVDAGPAGQVIKAYEDATLAAMAQGVPLAVGDEGEMRSGTHEVEIVDVRLRAAGLLETGHVRSGQAVEVELHYRANEPVEGAVFTLSIHTEAGERCLDVSTQGDAMVLPPLEGTGVIILRFDRLDLASGQYRIDVGVYDAGWRVAYDYWWRRVPFEVHGVSNRGPLSPPRSWRWGGAAGDPPHQS